MRLFFQGLLVDRGDGPIMLGTSNPVRDWFTTAEALLVFLENLVNISFPVGQANHQLLGAKTTQLASSTISLQPAVALLLFNRLLLTKVGLPMLLVGTGPQA